MRHTDGHDFPGHIDELALGEAAVVEDVVVGLEDTVGEPVVAHELPDVGETDLHCQCDFIRKPHLRKPDKTK